MKKKSKKVKIKKVKKKIVRNLDELYGAIARSIAKQLHLILSRKVLIEVSRVILNSIGRGAKVKILTPRHQLA